MNETTIIKIALWGYFFIFSTLVSKIRNNKVRIAMEILTKIPGLIMAVVFKCKILAFIFAINLFGSVYEVILVIVEAKIEMKYKKNEQMQEAERRKKQDEGDGVVYTLKENEFKVID